AALSPPPALPYLAAGWGFRLTIVWRGYGGSRWPAGDVVRWRGPDGSATLLYHLSPDGYEFGSHLPSSRDASGERWHALRSVLAKRSALGVVLLPHGADHHARPPRSEESLALLAESSVDDTVHGASTLAAFAARLTECAARKNLPIIEGELRDSYGYTWTLGETL